LGSKERCVNISSDVAGGLVAAAARRFSRNGAAVLRYRRIR
jgi:hypothetical protein